jgi:transcriptional regulator with XRE-family HTH domain
VSQLELALQAEVSSRHLSFVETGRSTPSRGLLLHLAEHLDVPLRERNTLLLSAGYAPTYTQTPLDDAEMAPVREAVEKILSAHEPFPALAVDLRWDIVSANRPARRLLTDGVAPSLLDPPANALRISLHPDGLAGRIVNLGEWSRHLLDRVHRQVLACGDPVLAALEDELGSYAPSGDTHGPHPADASLFVPLVLRVGNQELRFLSTLTTFGTALDINVAELAIESFFPGDEATAAALGARSAGARSG